jgi:hypothetical protein
VLSNYRRSRATIYFFGGPRTKAYAGEFYDMFRAQRWVISPPVQAPVGDERIIDVQIAVNYRENWNKSNSKPHDVLVAFGKAGIKQRSNLVLDPDVPQGSIVLWIGPRSPSDVTPNQCSPAALKPVTGQKHNCEMIAVTDGDCPFPPK